MFSYINSDGINFIFLSPLINILFFFPTGMQLISSIFFGILLSLINIFNCLIFTSYGNLINIS